MENIEGLKKFINEQSKAFSKANMEQQPAKPAFTFPSHLMGPRTDPKVEKPNIFEAGRKKMEESRNPLNVTLPKTNFLPKDELKMPTTDNKNKNELPPLKQTNTYQASVSAVNFTAKPPVMQITKITSFAQALEKTRTFNTNNYRTPFQNRNEEFNYKYQDIYGYQWWVDKVRAGKVDHNVLMFCIENARSLRFDLETGGFLKRKPRMQSLPTNSLFAPTNLTITRGSFTKGSQGLNKKIQKARERENQFRETILNDEFLTNYFDGCTSLGGLYKLYHATLERMIKENRLEALSPFEMTSVTNLDEWSKKLLAYKLEDLISRDYIPMVRGSGYVVGTKRVQEKATRQKAMIVMLIARIIVLADVGIYMQQVVQSLYKAEFPVYRTFLSMLKSALLIKEDDPKEKERFEFFTEKQALEKQGFVYLDEKAFNLVREVAKLDIPIILKYFNGKKPDRLSYAVGLIINGDQHKVRMIPSEYMQTKGVKAYTKEAIKKQAIHSIPEEFEMPAVLSHFEETGNSQLNEGSEAVDNQSKQEEEDLGAELSKMNLEDIPPLEGLMEDDQ